MYYEYIFNTLWFAQPILQLVAAGILLRRKLHRKFPVFFAYLISQIAVFAAVFYTYRWGSYLQYFYAYWISAAISLILGFKVIHEIFLDVFRPYHALKDLGSVLFKWATLVMGLVAIVVAAASAASSQGPLVEAVLTVQRCVRVIQVGLILLLLVFSKYVGVSWRQFSFGVSLGFGVFALMELLVVALFASAHMSNNSSNFANVIAYSLSVVVWLAYSLIKSPAREAISTLLTSQRWDHSLADLQHPGSPDSLIPIFENMVDRAFSRVGSVPESALASKPLETPETPSLPPPSSKAQAKS
jgi:hypothetical protein